MGEKSSPTPPRPLGQARELYNDTSKMPLKSAQTLLQKLPTALDRLQLSASRPRRMTRSGQTILCKACPCCVRSRDLASNLKPAQTIGNQFAWPIFQRNSTYVANEPLSKQAHPSPLQAPGGDGYCVSCNQPTPRENACANGKHTVTSCAVQ